MKYFDFNFFLKMRDLAAFHLAMKIRKVSSAAFHRKMKIRKVSSAEFHLAMIFGRVSFGDDIWPRFILR